MTTDQQLAECRAVFEVYADANLGNIEKKMNGDYLFERATDGWEIWQTAYFARPASDAGKLQEALEEVQRRSSALCKELTREGSVYCYAVNAIWHVADRALSQSPDNGEAS